MAKNESTRPHASRTSAHGVVLRRLSPLATVLILVLAWHWVTDWRLVSRILIPPPAAVLEAFAAALADGTLARHTGTTLGEMAVGLLFGVSIGLAIGYAIAKAPLLEYILSPVIVAFQSTPIVAYAPLLIIILGRAPAAKWSPLP